MYPYYRMGTEARQRTNASNEADSSIEQTNTEQRPKYWDPLTEGVRWIEKYAEPMEKFFERIPEFISTFIATLAIFTFGSTLRGKIYFVY